MTAEIEQAPPGAVPVVLVTRNFSVATAKCQSIEAPRNPVTGFDIGPFFVHLGIDDTESYHYSTDDVDAYTWHVTHRASGVAVQKLIPTHVRAIKLAKELTAFDVWAGVTMTEILKALTPEQTGQIAALRKYAAFGQNLDRPFMMRGRGCV